MTGTAVLRVDIVATGDIDWALCSLSDLRLVRRDGTAFIECAADAAEAARMLLARAGARADAAVALLPQSASLVPARVSDLAPLDVAGAIDTVSVRVLAAGDAARATRQGLFRRRRHDADRLRAVLRGEDRMFAWRRIVWADRATLRVRALGRARPIVFDGEAVAHGQERRAFARDGALAGWLGR